MKYFIYTFLLGLLIASAFYFNTVTGAFLYSEPVHEHVSVNEFKNLLEEDVKLMDIRTLEEYQQGIIRGADNIDFYSSSFKEDLDGLDKRETYLIYCRTGSRTEEALEIMKELGFNEVYGLEGGITNWAGQGNIVSRP